MADVEKDIIFRIEADDRVSKKFNNIAETLAKLDKTSFNIGGVSWQGATKSITKAMKPMKAISPAMKSIGKASKGMEQAARGWNLLSVTLPTMFLAQRFADAAKSAIDPAMELVGANELYQQFLALKYLPTAIDQIDKIVELGDEWLNTSETTRKSEGDIILWIDRLSQAVSYTAQLTQTLGQLGGMFGKVGQIVGNIAGAFIGITTSVAILNDSAGQTIVTFGGMEQAIAINLAQTIADITAAKPEIKESVKGFTDEYDASIVHAQWAGDTSGQAYVDHTVNTLNDPANVKKFQDAMGNYIFPTTIMTPSGPVSNWGVSNLPTAPPPKSLLEKYAGKNVFQAPLFVPPVLTKPVVETKPIYNPSGLPLPLPATAMTGQSLTKTVTGTVKDIMDYINISLFRGQRGGIVSRPTLSMIGEAGPEAVIPLSRMGNMGSNVTIMNPVINLTSVAGRESSEQIAREVIQRIGTGLVRVGG